MYSSAPTFASSVARFDTITPRLASMFIIDVAWVAALANKLVISKLAAITLALIESIDVACVAALVLAKI